MKRGRPSTALVIGATGNFGGVLTRRLLADGWQVSALHRTPSKAARPELAGVQWRLGDALVAADVIRAAEGVDLIVHGANPPGYRNWAETAPQMLKSSLAAAEATGARLLFPGNIYNYGPDAFPRIAEDAPQSPRTRKGSIRVGMEQDLRAAVAAGAKVLIVRCGDFIAPNAGGSDWLSQAIVPRGKPLRSIRYPGDMDIRHAWAWLPDIAETCTRLLATPLADFETFHMTGYAVTGHEFVAALARASDRPVQVNGLPWLALQALSPFNETFRELLEMRYLWQEEVALDGARLAARLGSEPKTPLDEALRQALAGLGALPTPNLSQAA